MTVDEIKEFVQSPHIDHQQLKEINLGSFSIHLELNFISDKGIK